MFSPVQIAAVKTGDQRAPGAPGLSVRQVSNEECELTLTPPTEDVGGQPLSGLTFAQIAVLQTDAETAELYREDFEGAIPLAEQVYEPDVSDGLPFTMLFPIASLGLPYAVLARVADHPHG